MTAAAPTEAPAIGQPAVDIDDPDPDDLICWSVTTILDVLAKRALLYWAGEMTAVAAINQQSTWRGMLADCDTGCPHTSPRDCAAVKWLRDAQFRRPKDRLASAPLGTAIHKLCEEYALTGGRPDADRIGQEIRRQGGAGVKVDLELPVLSAMLDRFDGWLQRFTPAYQATEVACYSPTYGYAGTCDGFMTVDGVRFIVDYKSSREPYDARGNPKTPYPEQVGPQLAAYRHAEFAAVWRPRRTEKFRRRYYLLSESERAMAQPVPEVDGGLCIHLTPDACEAWPLRCDEEVHRSFLYVLESFRWMQETSKTAMGAPVEKGSDR